MYSFEYPYVFIIVAIFILCSLFCKPKNSYMYMPNFSDISLHVRVDYIKELLKWLSILLLIAALASPISKSDKSSTSPAHAVMLLMDVSDSMSRGRISVNSLGGVSDKLSVSKQIASDYIRERESDHVGIIVFGDFAYVASPLSFDHQSSAGLLETIKKGVAGAKTAMYDALFLSTRLLKDSKAKEKIAILLTDGFNTSGDVPYNAALRAIESEKLRVFTIGIGRYGEYDEKILKEIAKKSGGEFFSAANAKSLKNVYEHIDKLQKSTLDDKVKYDKNYLFMYPLGFAIFTFFAYLFLHVKGQRR